MILAKYAKCAWRLSLQFIRHAVQWQSSRQFVMHGPPDVTARFAQAPSDETGPLHGHKGQYLTDSLSGPPHFQVPLEQGRWNEAAWNYAAFGGAPSSTSVLSACPIIAPKAHKLSQPSGTVLGLFFGQVSTVLTWPKGPGPGSGERARQRWPGTAVGCWPLARGLPVSA